MDLPQDVTELLDALLLGVQDALGDILVGAYLRGSLALGDFFPVTSDVDVLVVTARPVPDAEFARLADLHARLAASSLTYGKRHEIAYVDRAAWRRFEPGRRHPSLGQGEALAWSEHRDNWILERWTVRECGVTLIGPEPHTLIDPIAGEDLRAAVRFRLRDWADWADQPDDPDWLLPRAHKAYVVETMCRALSTLACGQLWSKPRAVAWALATLPEPWRSTVERSQAWRTDQTVDLAAVQAAQEFVRWAASEGASISEANSLDAGQYTPAEIRKNETIYGRNFISPGGEATTRELLGLVAFTPGMRVLDVGSGLGGAAFVMAQTYGARVHGIDLSRNMLQIAEARCQEADLIHAVTFEHADILRYDCDAAFDLAHSRDVFLHIHDKARLLATIKRCLRLGGYLLFTDYLCHAGPKSAAFEAYIRSRQYDLRSLDEYRLLLGQAGFAVVLAQDRTAEFLAILERELEQLRASQLDARGQMALAQSWQDKIRRARDGEQRWGVFLSRKPV
ncbi:MAG TPA: methyltransferase domain-containing protein [Roseiflexaceae bacterium]|nr:methyltransferase domain-containing protein [Roseiflexaceae bacterium]